MSLYPLFAKPRTIEQASEILSSLSSGAIVIAGGQEIMPSVNYGVLMPDVYVNVGSIEQLRGIECTQDRVHIGALTVHRELQTNDCIKSNLPIIADASCRIGGGWQVHNRGTVGGNVVSMQPLYDIVPPLLALGASVDILAGGERRILPLEELMLDTSLGLGTTALLIEVIVPVSDKNSGWSYQKLQSTTGAYGSANCAAIVAMEDDIIKSIKAVVGAVQSLPLDVSHKLEMIIGSRWSHDVGENIEEIVSDFVTNPLSDHQGEGEWRRAMAGVVTKRAIRSAIVCALGGVSNG